MAGKQEISKTEKKPQVSVEEAFQQLEQIIADMEAPDVTLESSMQLYRTGVELLNQCKMKLDGIEAEMITLTEEGEIPDEEYE